MVWQIQLLTKSKVSLYYYLLTCYKSNDNANYWKKKHSILSMLQNISIYNFKLRLLYVISKGSKLLNCFWLDSYHYKENTICNTKDTYPVYTPRVGVGGMRPSLWVTGMLPLENPRLFFLTSPKKPFHHPVAIRHMRLFFFFF